MGGCLGEDGVQIVAALIAEVAAGTALFLGGLGKLQRVGRTRLLLNVVVHILYLGSVDKGALHTNRLVAVQEEHVAAAHQLVGAGTVQNGARVNHRTHLEGHAAGEVGLDVTGDDAGGGALGGYHHVDAHGTGQLGDTGDGELYLLAGGHDEVAELVDNHHYVGHVLMAVGQTQLAVHKLAVVFLDVARTGFLQQVVAGVHQHAKALQRANHLRHIGDDGLVVIVHRSHEMVGDGGVDVELHLLRVYQHKLQLVGVLLVEQRVDDAVQTYRLSLTGGTGHKQVGYLGQVYHEHFVRDGLAERNGKLHLGLLEFARVQDAAHRHNVGLGVRHLDTDGALAGYGGDDADAEGAEAQGDVVFQVADAGDAHTLGGGHLIQGDGGAYSGLNLIDLHTEALQHSHNLVLVGFLLFLVDVGLAVVVVLLEQVERGVFVAGEGLQGVDGGAQRIVAAHGIALRLLVFLAHGDLHRGVALRTGYHDAAGAALTGLHGLFLLLGLVVHLKVLAAEGHRGGCGLFIFVRTT